MSIKDIFIYEWRHFIKSPLKLVALLLFALATIYGLQNGYQLWKSQVEEIAQLKVKEDASYQKVIGWLEDGSNGPEDRSYVDVSQPLWAFYYLPSWVWKRPSPLLVFNIGQSEKLGYYQEVSDWSTIYDSDLSQEIANPERLAMGALDFLFMLTYISPLLLIILLYNVKGFEVDNDIFRLVRIQSGNVSKWTIARLLFYFLLLSVLVVLLMFIYAFLTDVFSGYSLDFIHFLSLIVGYIAVWVILFGVILSYSHGSSISALRMISLWLIFGVLIPAAVQQFLAVKFPAVYQTEFLDAKRSELYELYDLYSMSPDSLKSALLTDALKLKETKAAADSVIEQSLLSNTMPYLANRITGPAAAEIEVKSDQKNDLLRRTFWFNPIPLFVNHLNDVSETGYASYKDFRSQIQQIIDNRTSTRALDSWNKVEIDAERVKYYRGIIGGGNQSGEQP